MTISWIGRFDSFSIGNETVHNARLRIADLFQAHRVMVLPREHVALFNYNGGPIFQVVRRNETGTDHTTAGDGPPSVTPGDAPPGDTKLASVPDPAPH